MKILVEQFCTLSTSPSWQSWLYHFDQEFHSWYIKELKNSPGCNASRELMKRTLKEVDARGGSEKLAVFLREHFPQMIKSNITSEQRAQDEDSLNKHAVFDSYVPGILSYPRRIIFVGPKRELMREVRQFTIDKPVHDSMIVDDRAYVGYLEQSDMHLKEAIPMKNWQIAAYRNKNSV